MSLVVGTNAYDTVANADSYFNDRLNATVWKASSNTQKEQALITATDKLERLSYAGSKTSSSQVLQWPRQNVTGRDGTILDSSTIPQDIKRAMYEYASAMLENESYVSGSHENIKAIDAKGTSVQYGLTKTVQPNEMPNTAYLYVSFYLSTLTMSPATFNGCGQTTNFEDDKYGLYEGFNL